jgi:NAD-dependent DNA ligase
MSKVDRELRTELEGFLERHPGGWQHQDWTALLARLEHKGIEVEDADALGRQLEALRLERFLAGLGVAGLGPRRRTALAERFGTQWRFERASVDEIAALPTIPRALAERIAEARS